MPIVPDVAGDADRESRARISIHRMFTEKCDPATDARLAANAIYLAAGMDGPIKLAAERLLRDFGAALIAQQRHLQTDAPLREYVGDLRALTLACHASFWVFLTQAFKVPDAMDAELDEYLNAFAPQLDRPMADILADRFEQTVSGDALIPWAGALSVLGQVWVPARERGVPESELLKTLWASPHRWDEVPPEDPRGGASASQNEDAADEQRADGQPPEVAAKARAPIDPASVVDYTFSDDSPYLEDVTFRTAVIDGRLHGRLIGTRWAWCEYSADEDDEYTEKHFIDVSTDYVDLEKTTDLPHRVAMIPDSDEIRRFFAFPMVLRASKDWNDDDCSRRPAHEARMRAAAEAERIKATRRAVEPPGRTSYGTSMTPALESLEETAVLDGEMAARAIDYAARYGRTRRVPGRAVADPFYDALNKGGAGWRDLAGALAMTARADRWIAIAKQFGPDAAAQAAAPYRDAFSRALEHWLHALGQGGYPTEDPEGRIAPWLMLLGAMERDAKPSLIGRLFRR